MRLSEILFRGVGKEQRRLRPGPPDLFGAWLVKNEEPVSIDILSRGFLTGRVKTGLFRRYSFYMTQTSLGSIRESLQSHRLCVEKHQTLTSEEPYHLARSNILSFHDK